MPVLINWKICDNAPECSGIAVCKTGAMYWDAEKKKIGIDSSKCTGCQLCVKACPTGAILFAKDQSEYAIIEKQLEEDPRTEEELFVDRYGAVAIDKIMMVDENNFETEVLQREKFVGVEFWKGETITCLIHSTPYRFLEMPNLTFRKLNVDENSELAEKYNVKKLPSLVIFKDGKEIGRIEGKVTIGEKVHLKDEIKEIVESA